MSPTATWDVMPHLVAWSEPIYTCRLKGESVRIFSGIQPTGERHLDRGGPADCLLSRAVFALLGRRFVREARTRDRLFTVDPSCAHCGTCERVCPVAALQTRGKRTRMRGRYHHPDARADDIAGQRMAG